MGGRRRLIFLISIMSALVAGVAVTAAVVLYGAAFQQERARLVEVVHSRARLMESVARFDVQYRVERLPASAVETTLSQIREGPRAFRGFWADGRVHPGPTRR